jgi:hypothetical protein
MGKCVLNGVYMVALVAEQNRGEWGAKRWEGDHYLDIKT